MIPVYQEQNDDCFSACLASILELPLSDVPKFLAIYEDDWAVPVQKWLASLGLFWLDVTIPDKRLWSYEYWGYHIITGQSPRTEKTLLHAVVGLRGEMVHDPWPAGGGVLPTDDGQHVDQKHYLFGFLIPKEAHRHASNRQEGGQEVSSGGTGRAYSQEPKGYGC